MDSLNVMQALRADWDDENLSVLRFSLERAYGLAKHATDPSKNPLFDTPNRVMALGTFRWFAVDAVLAEAANTGDLKGITAIWLPLTDGMGNRVHALELRGNKTSVMALHLSSESATPRHSSLREERRFQNYISPYFPIPEFEDRETKDGLMNLLLVHGDKDLSFGFLRAYHDAKDPKQFVELSSNIVATPVLVPALDTEVVIEPEVTLKNHFLAKQSEAAE
jgi:hypothetical protein